jgi:hypothetical protein
MSFDIFLQGFQGGDGADGDYDAANRVLAPYLVNSDSRFEYALIRTPGGDEADVYGVGGTGLMVNHSTGGEIYDVLYAVAAAGGWAVIPVGCPTCVTSPDLLDHLPDALRDAAIVVASGNEIRLAIEES